MSVPATTNGSAAEARGRLAMMVAWGLDASFPLTNPVV
jgi:hypothetical protein